MTFTAQLVVLLAPALLAALTAGALARNRSREHAGNLRAIASIARTMTTASDLRPAVCRAAQQVSGAHAVALFEPDGTGGLRSTAMRGFAVPSVRIPAGHPRSETLRAYTTAEPVFVPSAREVRHGPLANARAMLYQPVCSASETVAVLAFGWPKPKRRVPRQARGVVALLADEAAIAIERAGLLRRAHRAAEDATRIQVARDLHDSVAQEIAAAQTYATLLSAASRTDDMRLVELLSPLSEHLDAGRGQMRALLTSLRSGRELVDMRLAEAVSSAAGEFRRRQPGVRLSVVQKAGSEPDTAVVEAVYFILREALHNVAKYAQAANVTLIAVSTPEGVHVSVADDGTGFDADAVGEGRYGIIGIRERAERLGGDLRLRTAPGRGTELKVALPCHPGAQPHPQLAFA